MSVRYCVWVKCHAGQRLNGTRWENVYSWHIHSVYETRDAAESALGTVKLSRETPDKCVRIENDWSLCGA